MKSPYPLILKFRKYIPEINVQVESQLGMVSIEAAKQWCKGVTENGVQLTYTELIKA